MNNIRPGRFYITYKIRSMLNFIRSFIILRMRFRFIVSRGFSRIPFSCRFWSENNHIILGNCVQFGENCVIETDVEFGDKVLCARNVSFVGRNDHIYNIVGKAIWDSGRGVNELIVVDDDVWIGHGAIILSGVKIGKGSIVAAGSVVTKNVEPYTIVAGNPAKFVTNRF